MSRPSHSFVEIAGVPTHYDRFTDPRFAYGTRGKLTRFHATEAFAKKLDRAFQELWKVCPLGKAEVIASAGAYVEKPGAHGKGRGFDIDGIFWKDKSFVTLHYPQDRRFYLGVEAVLRKHFGNVLNYEYNRDHHDHFHVDDLTEPSFRTSSRARVAFLQMALTYLFNRPVGIDGKIGSETNRAARAVLAQLGLAKVEDVIRDDALHAKLAQVWPKFLDKAAQAAFADLTAAPAPETTPLELIESLYGAIATELGGMPARKQIETALTTFVSHEETAKWLEKFR